MKHGTPWRNRFVEGKSTFDLEDMHLSVEGTRVELEVDVPPAIWRAFP